MTEPEFDIAIIGGGAAGCILAARLSEDPGRRVALFEAGADTPPEAVPADIRDPFPIAYSNPAYFWPRLTAVGLTGRPPSNYVQPRIMGGGSSVMGMWALRGMPHDYDAWREVGATGWGWDDVLPAFNRLEHDFDFAGPQHGQNGPIPVRRNAVNLWPGFARAVLQAAEHRGLPFRHDINADFADGVFPVPVANDSNSRVSSATGYLTAEVRRRTNLKVTSHAYVTRILIKAQCAVGVEVQCNGQNRQVYAREVILSAGGIHSPALLLRSGIGPVDDLRSIGILPCINLPGVGRGLQNHCVVNLATILTRQARQASTLRTYGLACARVSSHAKGAPPGDLHLQIIAKTGAYAHGNRIGLIGAALYAPVSRGSVTLASADPYKLPSVDFRLLEAPLDRQRMKQIVRLGLDLLKDEAVASVRGDVFAVIPSSLVRRLNRPSLANRLMSAAMAVILDAPAGVRRMALRRAGHLINLDDEPSAEQMDALLEFTVPVYHPTGSCTMGRADDVRAVVDPCCRVRGIGGLRVVDASIMPIIPSGNTCLPTMMVAEHAARLIVTPSSR
jgi:choline dehydrogenase-like flavoprotein